MISERKRPDAGKHIKSSLNNNRVQPVDFRVIREVSEEVFAIPGSMRNSLRGLREHALVRQHYAESQLFYIVANIPTTAAVMIAAVAHPK